MGSHSVKLQAKNSQSLQSKYTKYFFGLFFFFFSPKVAHPRRLYGVKIMKIQAIESLTLGTFNAFSGVYLP
jgi:hypothetical protein